MKKWVYMAVLALIAAGGILWSCQKEETQTNPDKGLMLKSASGGGNCELDCIAPDGPYFIKTYIQNYDVDKWVQIDVYNTPTQMVYKITSSEDITEVWYPDAGTLLYADYTYNKQGKIDGGVPATQPFIITEDLASEWSACDIIENIIRVSRKAEANPTAGGNSQTFATSYSLIGVCPDDCEESFYYETEDNLSVKFVYVSDVALDNAVIEFTCPQIDDYVANDNKVYSVNPGQSNGTDNVLTWTGNIAACDTITFDLNFTPHCVYNDNSKKWNSPKIWTDFKVNGESKKGSLSNIEYTGCH